MIGGSCNALLWCSNSMERSDAMRGLEAIAPSPSLLTFDVGHAVVVGAVVFLHSSCPSRRLSCCWDLSSPTAAHALPCSNNTIGPRPMPNSSVGVWRPISRLPCPGHTTIMCQDRYLGVFTVEAKTSLSFEHGPRSRLLCVPPLLPDCLHLVRGLLRNNSILLRRQPPPPLVPRLLHPWKPRHPPRRPSSRCPPSPPGPGAQSRRTRTRPAPDQAPTGPGRPGAGCSYSLAVIPGGAVGGRSWIQTQARRLLAAPIPAAGFRAQAGSGARGQWRQQPQFHL